MKAQIHGMEVKDWIALRDGRRPPRDRREKVLCLAYSLKNVAAHLEQDAAQRRPMNVAETQAFLERQASLILETLE